MFPMRASGHGLPASGLQPNRVLIKGPVCPMQLLTMIQSEAHTVRGFEKRLADRRGWRKEIPPIP